MNEYDPTSGHETTPDRSVSKATSGPPLAGSGGDAGFPPPPPPAAWADSSVPVPINKQLRRPSVRRLLSNRRSRWITATALVAAVIGLSAYGASRALATSPSATPAASGSAGGLGSGGAGSNARSGPAAGGASGTVASVSTASFTLTTSAGQKVTVDEASSTTYQNGTSATSASAITTGEDVLVLGTTSGTTITATQVIVQAIGGGSAASSAAGVIPFQRGAATTSKQVGQIPASYSQGSGTIVGGTTANQATEAALAAYPGGIVDRVVQLSNGEYEVHYIGVNWPHHIFVNQSFTVVGAN
jgi:hypothetical protein